MYNRKDLSEIDEGLLQECFRILDISGADDDEEVRINLMIGIT